jgi:HJR/Mrr/RecB family endonuclease
MSDWKLASAMLDRFERDDKLPPAEAEKLVSGIFRACGLSVLDAGFVASDRGVDMFLETNMAGVKQRISVEVKYSRGAAREASVQQLLAFREQALVDRAIIVSRFGFTPGALRFAFENSVGLVDLLSPADLRNWLRKHAPAAQPDKSVEVIIRSAMKAIARTIAHNPEQLATLEWRDLERVLRDVFERLGFDTKLTRPGKDGGFDLQLTLLKNGEKMIYLIEVKHWTDQKPGLGHLTKFVHVTASKQATAGLLLSSSGFTKTLYEAFAKLAAPIRLGDGSKIVSLCQAYYRLDNALWIEATDLEETLFEGTLKPVMTKFNV